MEMFFINFTTGCRANGEKICGHVFQTKNVQMFKKESCRGGRKGPKCGFLSERWQSLLVVV